jgi:predicted Zn-dependent protease with MMP-like domain
MKISSEQFVFLVRRSWRNLLRSLPADLKTAAQDISVIIEDKPSKLTARETDNDELLGIYDGTPLNERYAGQVFHSTNVICIYRITLEESCNDLAELKREIRITLIHELGHHLGFDEEELAEMGLD